MLTHGVRARWHIQTLTGIRPPTTYHEEKGAQCGMSIGAGRYTQGERGMQVRRTCVAPLA
jgi:hypothetical protein